MESRLEMRKKLLIVDVGTHRAQEYCALFKLSTFGYALKFLRRIIGALLGIGSFPSMGAFLSLVQKTKLSKAIRPDCYYVFVEPNQRLFQFPIYQDSDLSVNIALSKSSHAFQLCPLYFANNDTQGQGSSIFLENTTVKQEHYINIINIDALCFAQELKTVFETVSVEDYGVVLRINNEGAEADVIYAFEEIFSNKLRLVLGSLKDTGVVKGAAELEKLHSFLDQKGIKFVNFSSSLQTWEPAIDALVDMLTPNH